MGGCRCGAAGAREGGWECLGVTAPTGRLADWLWQVRRIEQERVHYCADPSRFDVTGHLQLVATEWDDAHRNTVRECLLRDAHAAMTHDATRPVEQRRMGEVALDARVPRHMDSCQVVTG